MFTRTELYYIIFIGICIWLYWKNNKENFQPNDIYALQDAHQIIPNIRYDKSYYNQINCQ